VALASIPPSLRLIACSLIFTLGFVPIAAVGKSSRASFVDVKRSAVLPQATHLYEARGENVVAYPLNKDGFPARSPDWELAGGLRGAIWVGFDGAGYLYVSDAVLDQVRIYAPGASGADQPVRIIPLPGNGCAGYVFVTVLINGFACGTNVAVYAPLADSPGAGLPLPIHTISMPPPYPYVYDIVVDNSGRLFLSPFGGAIYVYNDPVNEWQAPNQTIVSRGQEYGPNAPLAVDSDNGDVYFQTQLRCCRPWQNVDVHAARSLSGVGLDRITESLNCDDDGEYGGEYSLAVNQNWLMYTCEDPNVLFVSHNRPGHQEAVEKLPGGYGLVLWP
jgi:hypothetical protein